MKRTLLLGIDVGTQSTRAALLTPDGVTVASASRPQELSTPQAGWAEQDPDQWWANLVACLRTILAQPDVSADEIAAVGVGGQMHGTVPLAADGSVLSHQVQLWCDKRSAPLVEAFKKQLHAEQCCRRSGNPPVPNWIGFKLQWLRQQEPELYRQSWKFVTPKDYVNFRLTGEVATDYSEASGAFLMDAARRVWSPELFEELGLDPSKLPDIHRSAAVIGQVTA
ncbi:MAG: FGGY-family carbohydrate kinase, partial [Caldilinea sp.]